MKDKLKKPCIDCPFKKDSLMGWLANYTPQELHSIVMNENQFPCHMTHEKDISWNEANELPLCAGALRYMKKGAKLPRNKKLSEAMKTLTNEDLTNILSVPEFFEYHTPIKRNR